MQVIRGHHGSRQGPFVFIPPVTSDEDLAVRRFVSITPSHHKKSYRRFAVNPVVASLQPMIEPAHLKIAEINTGLRSEFRLPGVGEALSTMPRSEEHTSELQ